MTAFRLPVTSHVQPGDIRIRISGWRYNPWRGVFYPKGLAQKRELAPEPARMPFEAQGEPALPVLPYTEYPGPLGAGNGSGLGPGSGSGGGRCGSSGPRGGISGRGG
jgi:hypothetical protein